MIVNSEWVDDNRRRLDSSKWTIGECNAQRLEDVAQNCDYAGVSMYYEFCLEDHINESRDLSTVLRPQIKCEWYDWRRDLQVQVRSNQMS